MLCFGGVAATAEAFYKQLLALAARGYRVVAADPPPCATHAEWIRALDLFLDALKIYKARERLPRMFPSMFFVKIWLRESRMVYCGGYWVPCAAVSFVVCAPSGKLYCR